jgi:hypothetical protein
MDYETFVARYGATPLNSPGYGLDTLAAVNRAVYDIVAGMYEIYEYVDFLAYVDDAFASQLGIRRGARIARLAR